eukprot:6770080-Prymnesium_polylepis.1
MPRMTAARAQGARRVESPQSGTSMRAAQPDHTLQRGVASGVQPLPSHGGGGGVSRRARARVGARRRTVREGHHAVEADVAAEQRA